MADQIIDPFSGKTRSRADQLRSELHRTAEVAYRYAQCDDWRSARKVVEWSTEDVDWILRLEAI